MRNRLTITALSALVTASAWATASTGSVAHATTATIASVEFAAAQPGTYDHAIGGGAWNDGSEVYTTTDLSASDFSCGDVVSFLARVTVAASPSKAAPYSALITVDFSTDTTGAGGAALLPMTDTEHVLVNSGVVAAPGAGLGAGGSDGGFVPSTLTPGPVVGTVPAPYVTELGAVYSDGATDRLTFEVTGLSAGSATVIRMDARIACQQGTSPTGDLHADIADVTVMSPAPDEVATYTAPTVTMFDVDQLALLDAPALVLSKTVSQDGSTCPGEPTLTLAGTGLVRYCYTVTNYGGAAATDIELLDDYATPGDGSDDEIIDMVGMTDEDGDTFLDDLAGGGANISGTFDVVFPVGGIFTNTVITAVSNPGALVWSDTATVTVQADVVMDKTVTTATGTCPGTKTLTVPTSNLTEDVTYCYTITNYSAFDVYDLIVDDTGAVPGTWTGLQDLDSGGSDDDLPAGATATLVWTPTLDTSSTAASVATLWWTDGFDLFNTTSTATVEFVPVAPELTVSKAQTSADPARVGDVITYSISAVNTGNVALTGVVITDDNATLGTCPGTPDLAVGAVVTCAASHVVTDTDMLTMSVDNIGVGHANGPSGALPAVDSNSVTTFIVPTTALSVTITQTSSGAPRTGDTVTYELVVTNSGNQPVLNVMPTVTNGTLGACTPTLPADLLPGETITCVVTHVVTAAETTAKVVSVVAGAEGENGQGQPVVASLANSSTLPTTGSTGATLPWAAWLTLLGALAVAVGWRRRELIWVPIED